jgi:uncharacterized protein
LIRYVQALIDRYKYVIFLIATSRPVFIYPFLLWSGIAFATEFNYYQSGQVMRALHEQDNEMEGVTSKGINMNKNTRSIFTAGLLLGGIMLSYCGAAAQEPTERAPRATIRTTGEASVKAKPDQALLHIGVVTQAQTAQSAATQNAQRLDTVLAELRRALAPEAEIKTISYSLHPNYRYPREGGAPTLINYTATNIVQVTINDLARVGKAIDVATQSGANQIQRLQFILRDEQTVRAQALREAVNTARAKAETIAATLGTKVSRVVRVEENSPMVQPLIADAAVARAEMAAAPTPIEPGTIEVRAVIHLTAEIAP